MTRRWKNRPDGANWGEFGPDDELGRLNLLTPDRVRRAVAEVREGLTFCLSLPLDYPGGSLLNPRRHPPRRFATVRDGKANYNFPLAREQPDFTDVVSDDAVLIHTQYSTLGRFGPCRRAVRCRRRRRGGDRLLQWLAWR
jgi:hypothetical protein